MNIRGKFFRVVMGPAIFSGLLAADVNAGGGNSPTFNNTIDQSKTTTIKEQNNKYDQSKTFNQQTYNTDKSINPTATGGTGIGKGGAGGAGGQGGDASGQTASQSVTGGNQTISGGDTKVDARGGAMPITSIGSLYVPHQCMKGLGVNLTGGMVFVAGGGIGLQFIDPAGVPLRGGITLSQYLQLDLEKRQEATKGFSDEELSSLNCITYVAEQEAAQRSHDIAMQQGRLSSEEKITRWNISYGIIQRGMDRYCAYAGPDKANGATKEEHDKYCHVPIDRALDELFPPVKEEPSVAPVEEPKKSDIKEAPDNQKNMEQSHLGKRYNQGVIARNNFMHFRHG